MNRLAAFIRTILTPDGFIASAYGYADNQTGHGWVGFVTFTILVFWLGPQLGLALSCAIWAGFESYNRFVNGKALPVLTAASSAAYMGSGAVNGQALWLRDERLALGALGLFALSLAIGVWVRE